MRRLIHERTSEHGLEAYARSYNPNMMDDARQKILQGLTSIEEVKRVIE
jgi:type II secretory ATPase GspE/PulE/Tfp pilus assembly ATPase PilB-like protein